MFITPADKKAILKLSVRDRSQLLLALVSDSDDMPQLSRMADLLFGIIEDKNALLNHKLLEELYDIENVMKGKNEIVMDGVTVDDLEIIAKEYREKAKELRKGVEN
jgi:hypothetical protein